MVNVRLVCLLVFKLLNTLGLKFPQKVTRALLTLGDGLLKGDYLGQVGQKDRVSWGVVGFGWWLLQVYVSNSTTALDSAGIYGKHMSRG